jgi:cysteine-rich repeat protein
VYPAAVLRSLAVSSVLALAVTVLGGCSGGSGTDAGSSDATSPDAIQAVCGDGVVHPLEECEDGNERTDDGCAACRWAVCGDGVVRAGVEDCDTVGGCVACTDCGGVTDPATGHCYSIVEDVGTRAQAQASCALTGAHLAAIDTAAEWQVIAPLWLDPYPPTWIGLFREVDGANVWRWDSGAPLGLELRWSPGEPNDAAGIEDCVEAVGLDGVWNDLACDQVRRALCERTAWAFDPGTNHAYRVFHRPRTHIEAINDCADLGGHLTAITSAAEQAFVVGIAPISAWIGAFQAGASETQWFWSSAEPFEFTAWGVGQPDDFNGLEDCVHLTAADGSWNDLACDARLPYVCEVH